MNFKCYLAITLCGESASVVDGVGRISEYPSPRPRAFQRKYAGVMGTATCKRGAFTLIELMIVVAITALLAALLLPLVGMVRDRSKLVSCGSNERQLAIAAMLYAQDQDALPIMDMQGGGWGDPNPSHWTFGLSPYLSIDWKFPETTGANNVKPFRCPGDPGSSPQWMSLGMAARGYWVAYGINQNTRINGSGPGRPLSQLPVPLERFMIFADLNSRTQYGDGYPGQISGFDWYTMTSFRHPRGPKTGFFQEIGTSGYWNTYQVNGVCNCVFADGHVQALKPREFTDKSLWGGY